MNFHNIAMSVPNMSSFVPQGPFYALQPQIKSIPQVYFCLVPNMMYCQSPQIPLSSQFASPQTTYQSAEDITIAKMEQDFQAVKQNQMEQNSNSSRDLSKRGHTYQTINQNNTVYSLINHNPVKYTSNTGDSLINLPKLEQVPEKKIDNFTQSSSTQEFKQFDAILHQKDGVKEEVFEKLMDHEIESDFDPNESGNLDRERRGKGHLWSPQELKRLVNLYKNTDGNWKQIVQKMEGRSISQCSQKFRKIMKDKYKKKKNKWTEEEDELLLKGVEKFGKDWLRIAEGKKSKLRQELGERNCKQVRDRFINKLDPMLTDRPWTELEDQQLLELYKQQGKKWTLFSKILKGRSENQVKNRFYYRIMKRFLKNQSASKCD